MRFLSFSALAILSATAANAGGLNENLHYEGRLFLGASDRVPGADAFLVGDATVRLNFGRIGAELGMYGRADALDTPHETYGALTYSFDNGGKLSAGVPRPAYDGFATSMMELAFPSLAIDRTLQTRSAATQGAMFIGWLPLGVTYEKREDGFEFGASIHHAKAVNATVIGLGAATTVGDYKLSGAVESMNGEFSAKAQVSREIGIFGAGIGYFAPQAAGASDLIEGYATVQPWTRIGLTTVVQVPTDGSAATGGFSARYTISDRTGIAVGVASDAGSDAVYNAFLDFKF